MKRKTREEKGITLIALIITIVVLLILAVVAINAVTGDGIIQHATNAKTTYENAQAIENDIIYSYESYLDKHTQNKKIITFTCKIANQGLDGGNGIIETDYDEEKLQAEEGMTWYEWCKSSYNKVNFECESLDSEVIDPDNEWIPGQCLSEDEQLEYIIKGKDKIESNAIYYISVFE